MDGRQGIQHVERIDTHVILIRWVTDRVHRWPFRVDQNQNLAKDGSVDVQNQKWYFRAENEKSGEGISYICQSALQQSNKATISCAL